MPAGSNDKLQESKYIPRGYQSIKSVPGLGSIAARFLIENQITNLADLARLDPYDERFTKLGEDFPRWVFHARSVVADEVIRSIEVRGEAIVIFTFRQYDKQATLKSVLGRLGVYYIYVDADVKDRADAYEITLRLKPEQFSFAQAQWAEYKANAVQLQQSILGRGRKEQVAKESRGKWRSLLDLDYELAKSFREEVSLLFRLYLRLQVAPNMNMLVLWNDKAINRTLFRLAIENIAPRILHFVMGGCNLADVGVKVTTLKAGSIVIIDDVEKYTPEEKKFLLDLLAARRVQDGERRIDAKCNIVMNVWLDDAERLDPDLLGLVDLAVVMPETKYNELEVPETIRADDEDIAAIDELVTMSLGKSTQARIDEAFISAFRPYKIPPYLGGYGSRLYNSLQKLAIANARIGYKDEVEESDITEASKIIQEALKTLKSPRRRK